MVQFALDIQTDPALQEFFHTFPSTLRNVLLRAAMRKAAVPVLAQARANVAATVRRTGVTTNPIIAGLRIRAGRARRGSVRVVVMTPPRAFLGIKPGSKWYYPAHIELGTRDTPALPFMRPAIAQTRDEATEIIRRELAKGLDALARGRVRGTAL